MGFDIKKYNAQNLLKILSTKQAGENVSKNNQASANTPSATPGATTSSPAPVASGSSSLPGAIPSSGQSCGPCGPSGGTGGNSGGGGASGSMGEGGTGADAAASGGGAGGATKDGISAGALHYAMRTGAAESGAGVQPANVVSKEINSVNTTIAMSQGIKNGYEVRGVSFKRIDEIAETLKAQGKVNMNVLDVGYTQHNAIDNKAYGLVNYGSYKDQIMSVARHVQNQANKNPQFAAALNSGNFTEAEKMNKVPGWNTTIYKSSHISNKNGLTSRIQSQYGGDPWAALEGLNGIYGPTDPIEKMMGPGYVPPGGSGEGGYAGGGAGGGGGGGGAACVASVSQAAGAAQASQLLAGSAGSSSSSGGGADAGTAAGAASAGGSPASGSAAATDDTSNTADPRSKKVQYTCYSGPGGDLTTLLDIYPNERSPEDIAKWGGPAYIASQEAKLRARLPGWKPTLHASDAYKGCYVSPNVFDKSIGSSRWPGHTRLKFTKSDGSPFNPSGENPEGIYTVTDTGNAKNCFLRPDFFTKKPEAFKSGAISEVILAEVISMGTKKGPQYILAHKMHASGQIPEADQDPVPGKGTSGTGVPGGGASAGGGGVPMGGGGSTSGGAVTSGGGSAPPIIGQGNYQDTQEATVDIHDICLLTINRGPTENDYGYFATRALKDYFKRAGKDTPGELQIEHFFIQEVGGEAGKCAPIAPRGTNVEKAIDLSFGGMNIIKEYKFVDVSPMMNAGEFVSRPVHSFNFKTREYKINYEGNTVELARKFISEHYINEVMTSGSPSEKNFTMHINPDKIKNKNIKPVYSLYTDYNGIQQSDGIHHLLWNGIFQNECINFDVPGATYREPGTFIAIEHLEGGKLDSTFDTRFLGQWFVIKVTHMFTNSQYTNNITAVKIHRHDGSKAVDYPAY